MAVAGLGYKELGKLGQQLIGMSEVRLSEVGTNTGV